MFLSYFGRDSSIVNFETPTMKLDASMLTERQWHLRSVQAGAIYQQVWVSGSKGQLDPGHRHVEHFGAPRATVQHTPACHSYIHKRQANMLRAMWPHLKEMMTHIWVLCVPPWFYLVLSHAWEWHSWKLRVCDQRLWECGSVWQNPKETWQELLLLDKTMQRGENEKVRRRDFDNLS